MVKELFLTKRGFKAFMIDEYPDVVELDENKSILFWMMALPTDISNVVLLCPSGKEAEMAGFKALFETAVVCRNNTVNAHQAHGVRWVHNALDNKERILASKTVDEIGLPPDTTVLVCGNGPSLLEGLKRASDADTIFTNWHSAFKLVKAGITPDFVGHIDSMTPWNDFEIAEIPLSTGILASPTVTPNFLNAYPHHTLYTYLGQDNPWHGWFADKMGKPDHLGVACTVVNMLVLSALYAGAKRIVLTGVDLSHPDKDHWDFSESANVQPVTNQFGYQTYTDDLLTSYKRGMEMLVHEFPNVEFYNASRIGLDIDGYKPY